MICLGMIIGHNMVLSSPSITVLWLPCGDYLFYEIYGVFFRYVLIFWILPMGEKFIVLEELYIRAISAMQILNNYKIPCHHIHDGNHQDKW